MATNHGGADVIIHECPIFGCYSEIELPKSAKFEFAFCKKCQCPMWPLELGFTGNHPDTVKEFARTHDIDGKLKKEIRVLRT